MSNTITLTEKQFSELWAFAARCGNCSECPKLYWSDLQKLQPETKTGNPMPEILPGYLIAISGSLGAVLRNDEYGLIVFLGGTATEVFQFQIEEIRNENQKTIWVKKGI